MSFLKNFTFLYLEKILFFEKKKLMDKMKKTFFIFVF